MSGCWTIHVIGVLHWSGRVAERVVSFTHPHRAIVELNSSGKWHTMDYRGGKASREAALGWAG
jgi:hypothetical protein